MRSRIRLRQIEAEAEGYLELGMPHHVLETLARLGDATALSSHALYLQGEALKTLGRYAEALVPLVEAARIAPGKVHVWLSIGWCQKRIGRIRAAIEALEEALAVAPGEAIVHYNLACYFCLAGNKSRALAHLAEALLIDPAYRDRIGDESDFDAIRADADFQALTSVIV
jgi:Flp pilus assembly protein TadD